MVYVCVESAGAKRAWVVAPSWDNFLIVLVIILEEEDGSHEGSEVDVNCNFNLGFDLESGTDKDDLDLVFLSDCDWPVFFSSR